MHSYIVISVILPAHIITGFITLTVIRGEDLLHPAVTATLLGPDIFLMNVSSDTLSLFPIHRKS